MCLESMLQRWHLLWAFTSINHLRLLLVQVDSIVLSTMLSRIWICIDLALPVLDVKRVRSDLQQRSCTFDFHWLEYFRCPTNGFYADAYGCAQGKYFECVERSLFTNRTLQNDQCLSLSRSDHHLSNVSTRSALQLLPRPLWLCQQCCLSSLINISRLFFLHSFRLFSLFLFLHFSHWNKAPSWLDHVYLQAIFICFYFT